MAIFTTRMLINAPAAASEHDECIILQSGPIDTADVDTFGRQIAPVARELDVRLRGVRPLDDDLESVFRYLVGG